MEPLVSVIMGVYNGEETISSCIDSIIAQTYKNWEFIICDDKSTDGTLSILYQYQKVDSRIVIIKNDKNLRLAASLNKCLSYAKGKYIARMDADDESLPNRLYTQVNYLEQHPNISVVGCNRYIFDDNGIIGIRKSIENPQKSDLLTNPPFAHPTIVMRKTVYDDLNGYVVSRETMRAEDVDLWFRFFEKGYRGYNIQEVLYKYREGIDDYKKRTLEAGIQTAKVFWKGYSRIQVPFYQRFFALKPIISAIVPAKLKNWYYGRQCKQSKELQKI